MAVPTTASIRQPRQGWTGAQHGPWAWADGSTSTYRNWAGGEPNDWRDGAAQCDGTGNQDCVEAWRGGADWQDAGCARAVECGVPADRVVNTRSAEGLLARTHG